MVKIICCLSLIISSSCGALDHVTALHRNWGGVEDLTEDVKLKLNSAPGLDENIISNFAIKKGLKKPFLVRQGNVIYFANPSLVNGALWWKAIKVTYIKKQVWDDFLKNPNSILKTPEYKILSEVLEPSTKTNN